MWKACTISAVLLVARAVYGASFDCERAHLFAERVICSEQDASKWDEDISSLYKGLLPGSRADLRGRQKEWLKQRNACAARECVYDLLKTRRLELLAGADSFAVAKGEWRGINYGAVVGMKGGDVLWLRFVSLDKRGSECIFSLRKDNGFLVANSGYAFDASGSGGQFAVRLRASLVKGGRFADFCGSFAVPPEAVRVRRGEVVVEYDESPGR